MILTKRQKQILDYVRDFVGKNGYAPSLIEISRHFNLHSISTIHKHLVHLEEKGLIRRHWNRARAIEVLPPLPKPEAQDIPLVGLLSAGQPIEEVRANEMVAVPNDMIGRREVYVLKVKGESLVDEQVRDGDYIVVENRTEPRDGETVVALLERGSATLKKFYRDNGDIRLQPAQLTSRPIQLKDKEVRIRGVVIGLLRKY